MVGVSSVAECGGIWGFVRGISPAPLQTNLAYYPMDTTIYRHNYVYLSAKTEVGNNYAPNIYTYLLLIYLKVCKHPCISVT